MSSSPRIARRTERPRPRAAALVATVLSCALVAGCGGDDPGEPPPGQASAAALSAQRARTIEQRILDQRAKAVRDRNLGLFLRRVDRHDSGLVARQTRYFRNLVQLPLQRLRWDVEADQWTGLSTPPSWGQDVRIPRITTTLQLAEYDERPVTRTDGLVFSFQKGRATIVADRTAIGKPLTEGTLQPWDQTAITVREEPGVLGVFDSQTKATRSTVVAAVRNGIAELDRALPFSWADHVVVYSVGDKRVLQSFTDVPGGVIDHLGAMTFPVYADQDRHVADVRMLVLPSSVAAGQPFLGRIVRHELSHVAIGARDDGAPSWFSEGLAEYLGARDLPVDQRIIPTGAVTNAAQPQTGMPPTEGFNGDDQEWHYALSWMAIDWIAATRGEAVVWQLMRALHAGGKGTTDAQQDMVLESVLGVSGAELAQQAAARIRQIYG